MESTLREYGWNGVRKLKEAFIYHMFSPHVFNFINFTTSYDYCWRGLVKKSTTILRFDLGRWASQSLGGTFQLLFNTGTTTVLYSLVWCALGMISYLGVQDVRSIVNGLVAPPLPPFFPECNRHHLNIYHLVASFPMTEILMP